MGSHEGLSTATAQGLADIEVSLLHSKLVARLCFTCEAFCMHATNLVSWLALFSHPKVQAGSVY